MTHVSDEMNLPREMNETADLAVGHYDENTEEYLGDLARLWNYPPRG